MPPVRKIKKGNTSEPIAAPTEKKNLVVSGQLEKRIQKQQQGQDKKRGVVFVKHLPHGFLEQQLKNYFEQFGDVTRVRLGRSRRTGGSKGYAFVEFEYPEVAEVAAETMDNYLMFQKVVKAAYIPPEKQIYNYFKTSVRKVKDKAGKEIYVSHKTAAIQRKVRQMSDWSAKKYQKRTLKKLEKIKKLNKKYAHLGIDFSKVLLEQPKKIENPNIKAAGKPSTSANNNEDNKSKKLKKDPKLQDLLGNSINDDDSSDEDYIAATHESDNENTKECIEAEDSIMDSDDAESSSDDETYGFTRESDDEEETVSTKVPLRKKCKSTINYEKSIKATNVDRFEKLIKRKAQTGAVQKAKKLHKPHKTLIAKTPIKSLQMKAAKEILKAQPAKKPKAAGLKTKSAKTKKF
ncbi:MKI67 FHA domain-interacting nucleolar phosphoprotein [Eurosta solidaginis]|uniref:MKI67 FHA domain-interacting nucleolar phosphoprotein n=1 Tax=Eurosta solidaginis TaxID=178769 RepID=UPI00353130DB